MRALSEVTELTDGQKLCPLPLYIVREHIPGAPRAWQTKSGLRIIAGDEPYLNAAYGNLRHVSFSRSDRLPGWKEVKLVKDTFFGDDAEAMIVLPKKRDYTNVHQFTHHLWQMPEPWTDEGPL